MVSGPRVPVALLHPMQKEPLLPTRLTHRFLLGESFRVSHFFSWWYILAALSNSLLRFP